jgi:hypothetical protein
VTTAGESVTARTARDAPCKRARSGHLSAHDELSFIGVVHETRMMPERRTRQQSDDASRPPAPLVRVRAAATVNANPT